MSEEYDLKESSEKLGPLVPIIKDAFGNIIDGFHRYKIDPDWPSITLEHIDDPIKLEKARVAINQCRRVVDAEERAEGYGKLIKMTGWTPKQLAENIGIPYRTIMRYLPDEHKEKSWDREPIATVAIGHESVKGDGEVGEEPEDTTATVLQPREFLAAPLICKACGIGTRLYPENFTEIDGKTYCKSCAEHVKTRKTQKSTSQETVDQAEQSPGTIKEPGSQEPPMETVIETDEDKWLRQQTDSEEQVTTLTEDDTVECPQCKAVFRIIHVDEDTHRLKKVQP